MGFERITLGRTGLSVTRLGLAASYGTDEAMVEEAVERGVNYLWWGALRTKKMARGIRAVAGSKFFKFSPSRADCQFCGLALMAGAPKTTKAMSDSSTAPTIKVFMVLVRCIPRSVMAVMTHTIASAIGSEFSGLRYKAKPSAAVAAEADFAQRNIHPATKPSEGFSHR